MSVFGTKLRNIRKSRGMRQSDVAEKVGVSRTALAYYEQGEREPSFEVIDRLAKFFEVPSAYFFSDSDAPLTNALAEKYGDLLSSPEIQAVMDELSSRSEDERRQGVGTIDKAR